MQVKRTFTVFGLLAVVWITIVFWQYVEHDWVKQSARERLYDRATDISNSLALMIRSLRPFVFQVHLEAMLQELAESDLLEAVSILNASGEVLASAGQPIQLTSSEFPLKGIRWDENSLIYVNLVDLGYDYDREGDRPPAIVVNATEFWDNMRRFRPGPPPSELAGSIDSPTGPPPWGNPFDRPGSATAAIGFGTDDPDWRDNRPENDFGPGGPRDELGPGPDENRPWDPDRNWDGPRNGERPESATAPIGFGTDELAMRSARAAFFSATSTIGSGTSDFAGNWRRDGNRRGRPRGGRPPFGRPPQMSPEEYQSMLDKQGLHGFVLLMSTEEFQATMIGDLWLRITIVGFALISTIGFGLAWRSVERSAGLQLRLIRAREMNARLREMNVAAAGLAHETRNPLNIVRGLAQVISKYPHVSDEIKQRSSEIAEEVDRVTARLNEFIDYSRPREAKPAPTHLNEVVRDVERTLATDIEDKAIAFNIDGPELIVEADEPLLRQVIFNLMLNSIQAVDSNDRVEIVIGQKTSDEAFFEIRDNGPGIPASEREDIFRPYFTTNEWGTGLGLAIVRQIVMVHGWEIEYIPNHEKGSIFRVSGLKVSPKVQA